MTLFETLQDKLIGGPRVRVRLVIKGRIGETWLDLDRLLRLPEGTTLKQLIAEADRQSIPLREALEQSPHLRHTLMLNGERTPLEGNLDRVLVNGDELLLLAPFAGG
ncbi:MAG: MoaD/ThiS family protein [Myxococcales bacterium]|nr:MoaD/ThiS family protein [Myxococcales bacterium]